MSPGPTLSTTFEEADESVSTFSTTGDRARRPLDDGLTARGHPGRFPPLKQPGDFDGGDGDRDGRLVAGRGLRDRRIELQAHERDPAPGEDFDRGVGRSGRL